jgi:hypothetical protein
VTTGSEPSGQQSELFAAYRYHAFFTNSVCDRFQDSSSMALRCGYSLSRVASCKLD